MIIGVAGIDRVGKSTFCKAAESELQFTIFREPETTFVVNMQKDPLNEADKVMKLVHLAKQTHSDVCFDRLHISDCVYSITRRKKNFYQVMNVFQKVDEEMAKSNVHMFFMKPESVQAASERAGEDLTVEYALFELFFDLSVCKKTFLTYDDIDDTIECFGRSIARW